MDTEIPGTKLRAVLATLALSPREAVSPSVLLAELWGDRPPRTAYNTLQGHVARLRRTLVEQSRAPQARELIRTTHAGYLLDIDPEHVDSVRFARTVKDMAVRAEDDAERAVAVLTRALGMWRGQALSDVGQGVTCRTAAAHLDETRLMAQGMLINAQFSMGLHQQLVPELENLTSRYPLRERFSEQLMLALYRSGRQADAIDVYHRVRRRLSEELGVEPGPGMQDQLARILRQEPCLLGA
ncbi:BTAD domain-containing putative transcriptional regulator [Streptomyces violascens]|uniref:AfsR/SARP family transcriptional regulator n=1 Tax=Streptomyces violascens TaxID=67381 RepID=UPI0037978FEA